MKLWKRARSVGEAVLIVAGLVLIPPLPRWLLVRLANACGDAGRVCGGKLRRIALANLDAAFGDSLNQAEKAATLRQAYRVFARVLLDLFWFSLFSKRRLRRTVLLTDSVRHYNETQPAVVVTAHFGNWEVLGQAAALIGDPIVSVATPLKNPVADFFLMRLRGRTGQRVERRAGAVRAMRKALRSGKRVALVLDQNILPPDGGTFVPFFGLPVPMSQAAAMLSQRTGAPILVAYGLAQPDGRYHVHCRPPLSVDGMTEAAGTASIMTELETVIREHPGQWLWMYKRWKYIPAGADAARYPFYARRLREQA